MANVTLTAIYGAKTRALKAGDVGTDAAGTPITGSGSPDAILGSSAATAAGQLVLSLANASRNVTFNNTLSGLLKAASGVVAAAVAGTDYLTPSGSETITGKGIDADNNTISNLETDNFKSGVIDTDTGLAANSDTKIPTQKAVKTYIDNARLGMSAKENCRVITTTNINLATDLENGDSYDGVTLATLDRVLVTGQSTASQNGIYVVQASGAAVRATDFNADADVINGAFVFIEEGTANADTGWMLTTDGTIVIGTTALTFTRFDAGKNIAGNGILKTGNAFEIDTSIVVTLTGSQTLTNKTITNAILNGTLTGTAVVDEDNMVSDSATKVPTQQSVKAYVDTQILTRRKTVTYTIDIALDGQNALSGTNLLDVTCPYAGYIVAASIKMANARTAGSFSLEPHINGTGVTPTGLDLLIDGTDTTKDYAVVAYGTSGYSVVAGDVVGFLGTTSSFTPLDNYATLTLVIEY